MTPHGKELADARAGETLSEGLGRGKLSARSLSRRPRQPPPDHPVIKSCSSTLSDQYPGWKHSKAGPTPVHDLSGAGSVASVEVKRQDSMSIFPQSSTRRGARSALHSVGINLKQLQRLQEHHFAFTPVQ